MNRTRGARTLITLLASLALAGCRPSGGEPRRLVHTDPAEAKRVLVVINLASSDSRDVGNFYRVQRSIPGENVLTVTLTEVEEAPKAELERELFEPLRKKLQASKHAIDYIVLTKGIPIRMVEGRYSVDGHVAGLNLGFTPIVNPTVEEIKRAYNPYFNKAERFSSKKYGFYLVSRLDGYSREDAKRLVTNSVTAQPQKGPFLFDADPTRKEGGYGVMQTSLMRASDVLKTKGFETDLDESSKFVGSSRPVAGYASWGSNDRGYSGDVYRSLRFIPGAVGETFVSTSGRTFKPTLVGQSLISDLIKQGITGVKGYVEEPYTFALAKPDILFDRYTSGFNLVESFYMASMVLKWRDMVIGDPLCNPYAKAPAFVR